MNTEPEAFAVDLSNDGIFLWHRKPSKKWEFLSRAPLNSGNLRQHLEKLKTVVQAISAPSLDAVVRIPSSEVHTLTVAHDPDTDISWEVRIISALEAVAKAPIKTLAFDIDRSGETSDICIAWTQMAVIEQAKTFVHLIGFNPTRYTTDVNIADFPRNPNFQITDNTTILDDQIHPESPDTSADNTIAAYQPLGEDIQAETTPVTPVQEQDKPAKSDFGIFWFIALFLILALVIAAIYYWPGFQQYWPDQQGSLQINHNLAQDQLFSAIEPNSPAIHFEKSKTIL